MKRILITGGTGFVGANFVYRFLELNNEVHLLVRPEAKFWRIEPVKKKVKLHIVDLTKEKDVEEFISDLKPEIILHFATHGAYQGKERNVKMTIDTNLLGTVNLINACSKIPFECFLNTGSNSEYGEKHTVIRETDLLEPNNLYGVTKAAATMYCDFFSRKMDLPVVTMRLFSVYGPYEDSGRFIPALVKSIIFDVGLNVVPPRVVRNFTFIDDVIDAYLNAIKKIQTVKGNIFNISGGVQYSLKDTVELGEKIAGRKLAVHYEAFQAVQHESKSWLVDISKARELLGWEPRHSLEEGLKKTLAWFKYHSVLYENIEKK